MLKVSQLACARGERLILTNLNFNLTPNSFEAALQLCGPNGIGKSTLLRTIAGLVPAHSGCVELNASFIYCGHKSGLHPALSPIQNLIYLCMLHNLPEELKHNEMHRALQRVDLLDQKDKMCAHLSAGQCQRIILALLMLSRQKLWILDEPLVNLDQNAKDLFSELMYQHLTEGGGVLLATHQTVNNLNFMLPTLNLENYV